MALCPSSVFPMEFCPGHFVQWHSVNLDMDDSWKYRPRTGLADLLPLITASWLTRALFPRHRTYRCLQWWSKDSWRSFEVIAVTPFDTWYINDSWSQLGLGETGSPHGGRTVILELVRSKCVPILLHIRFRILSAEYNADLRSLDFTFNRLFMKLFKTKSIDVVKACMPIFHWLRGPELCSKEENR